MEMIGAKITIIFGQVINIGFITSLISKNPATGGPAIL